MMLISTLDVVLPAFLTAMCVVLVHEVQKLNRLMDNNNPTKQIK